VTDPELVIGKKFKIRESNDKARFVEVEIKSLVYLNQKRLLFQVLDVSDSVLYDKSKEQNEVLSILNATVSHELRNPLNAIAGQNIEKEGLYHRLRTLTLSLSKTNDKNREVSQAINSVLDRLGDSLKV